VNDRTDAWRPDSWRGRPAAQLPQYPDDRALAAVETDLLSRPGLVLPGEIRNLREEIARAASGRAFLLQGGDCAESFAEHSAGQVLASLRMLLQMAVVLTFGAACPVVKVGRIAGQFAKPRSSELERRDGIELQSYRGDMVNRIEFEAAARRPDPARQLMAYAQSAATLNLIRSYTQGGYGDLHQVHRWNLRFLADSEQGHRYAQMADRITECLEFMAACGVEPTHVPQLRQTTVYTSHEALLLGYEQAFTRQDAESGLWYDTSAHMLWVGERTRQPDGAHVEFLRGIANPLGLKVGPGLTEDGLLDLVTRLDPGNHAGRLVLISRMGADLIHQRLPPLVRATRREGLRVLWACDPMHGNTETTGSGYKTRAFDHILREVRSFFAIHRAEGTLPGGIHFEMTGQDVTECTGGAQGLDEAALSTCYRTHCDPRLNASQCLELAFLLAETIKDAGGARGADRQPSPNP
jgi:3-deoxy-7-phosphoheptulonate synthase